MQKNVSKHGRKMVTIVDPHMKRDENYYIHKEASAKGLYIKNKDGGDFDGWCWPGQSSYLDFTSAKVTDSLTLLSLQYSLLMHPEHSLTIAPSIHHPCHPKARLWWAQQFALNKYVGSTMDLFTWNDMNEPSVFNGPEVSRGSQSPSSVPLHDVALSCQ